MRRFAATGRMPKAAKAADRLPAQNYSGRRNAAPEFSALEAVQRQLQEQRERNLELQKQLEKMQIEKNSYRKKAEEPKQERNRNKWAENVVAELRSKQNVSTETRLMVNYFRRFQQPGDVVKVALNAICMYEKDLGLQKTAGLLGLIKSDKAFKQQLRQIYAVRDAKVAEHLRQHVYTAHAFMPCLGSCRVRLG